MNSEQLHQSLRSYRFLGKAIPTYTHDGLVDYMNNRRKPGHFLDAVLCNDLKRAAISADGNNIELLHVYSAWLYNHADPNSYGSPEKVAAWISSSLNEEKRDV